MSSTSRLPDRLPTAEEFARLVLRSRLLEPEQLQAALKGVPRDRRDDTQALADHLVRQGQLTRYQAGRLLRGFADGLIFGPYRILAPLGKGRMGTVVLVRDQRTGGLLALKILPPKLARRHVRLQLRFRREMDLCQRVRHPHLCCTHEVGEYRGVPYIAMEYIPGKTLSRLVTDGGPLPLPRAARLMAEVAAALEHAHEEGLIHRDLKPSNILVTPGDHAKVLDLGLALVQGEEAGEAEVVGGQGYIVGTLDYIAPEQTIDAAGVDRRSDLYALGCTLYFALSGQPPFPGGTNRDKVMRQRHARPVPLGQRVPGLPGGFLSLVERLLAKDPAERPPTAAVVEAQLLIWAGANHSLAAPEDTVLDEQAIIGQVTDGSDYSLVSLPVVEVLDEPPPRPAPAWPLWLILLLAVATGLMLLAAGVVVMAIRAAGS